MRLLVLALHCVGLLVADALQRPYRLTLFLRLRPPTARYNGTALRLNATLTCRDPDLARAVRRAYCDPLL